MFSYKSLYQDFITPEKSGRKIGLFRILCSIFGGLIIAYLGMVLFAYLTPISIASSAIIPILFYLLVWACVSLWISVSPSKFSALLRVITPTSIFSILIVLFYKA
mgnify:CR=1 FL=1